MRKRFSLSLSPSHKSNGVSEIAENGPLPPSLWPRRAILLAVQQSLNTILASCLRLASRHVFIGYPSIQMKNVNSCKEVQLFLVLIYSSICTRRVNMYSPYYVRLFQIDQESPYSVPMFQQERMFQPPRLVLARPLSSDPLNSHVINSQTAAAGARVMTDVFTRGDRRRPPFNLGSHPRFLSSPTDDAMAGWRAGWLVGWLVGSREGAAFLLSPSFFFPSLPILFMLFRGFVHVRSFGVFLNASMTLNPKCVGRKKESGREREREREREGERKERTEREREREKAAAVVKLAAS